jgi:hypothetical protein
MQQKIAKPVLAELVRRGWTGGGFACSVLNASDRPQTIIMDLRDPIGRSVFGEPGTSTIPPWQTISAGFGFGGTTQAYCTLSSATAKKGDIKLGFCTTGPDGNCVAAVSAE